MPYTPLIVNDLLSWASIRVLVEPVVNTTLGTQVNIPGVNTITPGSMASIYNGAFLVVDVSGNNQEVVVASNVTATQFQANFQFTHLGTAPLYAATFPTGQPTDILFTQAEMLQYLAEALDDFILKTRPLYEIATLPITTGIQAYTTPADAIRIERISRQDYGMLGTNVITPGTYTISPQSMKGISNGTYLLVDTGASFEVVVASNVTATTFQATFAFVHTFSAALYACSIHRLWNVSITDLDNNDPKWLGERGKPTRYYEDELNVGQYGLAPLPSQSYSSFVWYSQRPILQTLISPLLIPDPLAYIPYYGMLARVFRKDGEMRDPDREKYCQRRYDVGVEIATRLLEAIPVTAEPGPVQVAANA